MSSAPRSCDGPALDTLEVILDVNYTWGYGETRAELRALYEKAQRGQWIPDKVIDFSIDVDLEAPTAPEPMHPLYGSDIYARMTARDHCQLNVEMSAWLLSQFLHGEQGALLAASQLVASVPTLDGKLYSATQVVDEARHVDVFNRYLQDKVGFSYPVNEHLKTLLDLILKDSRWDIKLIGMQIMVEGLALAAFSIIRQNTFDPLLRSIVRYVMADEARHVAFGVLALEELYGGQLTESEIGEREDFVYEAAALMRDRFLYQQVWDKLGMPRDECMAITLANEGQKMFRQLLFAKIVPAMKRIGLLSNRQRERFHALGILQFENWADPFADLEAESALVHAALNPNQTY